MAEEYAVNWYDSNFDITIDSIEADNIVIWENDSVDDWNASKQKVLSAVNPYIDNNTDYYDDRGGNWYGRSKKDPPPYMENVAGTLQGCINNLANDIQCSNDAMYIEDMWYEQLNFGDYH